MKMVCFCYCFNFGNQGDRRFIHPCLGMPQDDRGLRVFNFAFPEHHGLHLLSPRTIFVMQRWRCVFWDIHIDLKKLPQAGIGWMYKSKSDVKLRGSSVEGHNEGMRCISLAWRTYDSSIYHLWQRRSMHSQPLSPAHHCMTYWNIWDWQKCPPSNTRNSKLYGAWIHY